MFVLISTFEMSRGMWLYHTLAYAVKEGARYTVVHGQNSPNRVSIRNICDYIVQQGPGLIGKDLNLTFNSFGGSVGPYSAASGGTNTWCPTTVWPPNGTDVLDNQPGQPISITATFPFQSTIIMFWPGAKQPRGGMQFPTVTFPAAASDVMQF
jgi:hypothetical protein